MDIVCKPNDNMCSIFLEVIHSINMTDKHSIISDEVIVANSDYHIAHDRISSESLRVIEQLQDAGFQAYLVGGCVRDLLLDKTPKDFDVATDALPEDIKSLFPNCRLIGRRFRLAHVFFGRHIIEVATFRAQAEEETESQHTSEEGLIVRDNIYGTLEEDVWRRDFTINALYYDPNHSRLIDYAQGLADLKAKILRIMGQPENRYREDPVRMLRAIRFAAKLDFSIEDDSQHHIKQLQHLLGYVSPARLYDEVLKMFHYGQAFATFELLKEYKLLEWLFPQTIDCFKEADFNTEILLGHMLKNTDERVLIDKPVTPAFLFIVFLWHPMHLLLQSKKLSNQRFVDAFDEATQQVLQHQRQHTVIPKRFLHMILDVWWMQSQLENRERFHPRRLMSHPKFRAAYDFLVLRARIGEASQDLADWWTDFQKVEHEQQEEMLALICKEP